MIQTGLRMLGDLNNDSDKVAISDEFRRFLHP